MHPSVTLVGFVQVAYVVNEGQLVGPVGPVQVPTRVDCWLSPSQSA